MKAQYISRLTPFFASENISFELQLKKGSEIQDISGVDIGVELYTSQLSPRIFARSFAADPSQVTTPGVSFVRYPSLYILHLAPSLLSTLPTGVLTLVLRYYMEDGSVVTNKITTERFVNDMPVESFNQPVTL